MLEASRQDSTCDAIEGGAGTVFWNALKLDEAQPDINTHKTVRTTFIKKRGRALCPPPIRLISLFQD